ncbi:IdsF [Cronobacter turicensis]
MADLRKKNKPGGHLLRSLIVSVIFLTTFSAKAQDVPHVKYLFSFKSSKSTCLLRANDLPAFDNTTDDDGTIAAGFNMTAFLENGKNDIELLMGPQDVKQPQTLWADSACQVTISDDTTDNSVKLADYSLTVNGKKEISAVNTVIYATGTKTFEGYTPSDDDYGLYKMKGVITLDRLPEWSWVNATPVTENDLPKIRKAYEDIWMQIKRRDVEGLKRTAKISNEEMAQAEGTTPDIIFLSTDFPQHVSDPQLTPVDIEWQDYRLMRYRGGRLFRLAAGFFQNSPLMFKNSEGEVVFVYNPYFSIIDGNVVLVR